MSFSLFDMHVGAHEKVGTITYGITSASTDALSVEDQTESSAHSDDQFNSGIFYLINDANTTANAGQFRRITDYDASSGQFTWTTAFGTSIVAGSEYGIATPEFNFTLMNRLANAALRALGPFVYTARAIVSSANQRIYQISTAVATAGAGTFGKYSKPFLVEIQGRIGSSIDDPDWSELHGWKSVPTTAGAGGGIEFPRYLPSNRDVRVWYEDHHSLLIGSTARIDERIHPELATLMLVEKMYEFRNSRSRGAQEFDVQRWNDAKRQTAEARVRWPIERPRRQPEINVFGNRTRRRSGAYPYGGGLE